MRNTYSFSSPGFRQAGLLLLLLLTALAAGAQTAQRYTLQGRVSDAGG